MSCSCLQMVTIDGMPWVMPSKKWFQLHLPFKKIGIIREWQSLFIDKGSLNK